MYGRPAQPNELLIVAFPDIIVGVDPRTGQRVWVYRDTSIQAPVARIAIGTQVVIIGAGTVLTSLQYSTGAVLWRIETKIPVDTMLVRPDAIYIASTGEVACYSHSGQFMWHDGYRGFGDGRIALGFPGHVADADVDG